MIGIRCHKCSTPLSHDARFCSTCGTFIPSEDDQPDNPTTQISLLSPVTALKLKEIENGIACREVLDDITFTSPTTPLQEDEEHTNIILPQPIQTVQSIQLNSTHAKHEQPQSERADHQQPQNERSAHEQTQSEHTGHQQHERTSHQKTQSQYGIYHQPLKSPSHFQPGTIAKKQQRMTSPQLFSRRIRIGAAVTMLISTIIILSYVSYGMAAPRSRTSTLLVVGRSTPGSAQQPTPSVGGALTPGSTQQPALSVSTTPTPGTTRQSTSGTSVTPTAIPGSTPSCLHVDTTTLAFSATVGGNNPGLQSLTLNNGSGCGAGKWSATSDSAWLSLDQSSGNIDANRSVHIHVSAAPANLKVGTYTGYIRVNPGAKSVAVTLTVLQAPLPCITAKTNALTFTAATGGTAASQLASIANGANCSAGTWSVASDANWLHGQGGGSIAAGGSGSATVTVSTAGLAAGSYSGHLTFSTNGSKPAIVAVTLTIQSSLCPQISPKGLSFSGDVGANKKNPAPQTITVANSCGRATVTAVAGAPWLTVVGGGGVGADGRITLSVQATCLSQYNTAVLKPNTYFTTVTITITASDGTQASVKVPVTFTVTQLQPATQSVH